MEGKLLCVICIASRLFGKISPNSTVTTYYELYQQTIYLCAEAISTRAVCGAREQAGRFIPIPSLQRSCILARGQTVDCSQMQLAHITFEYLAQSCNCLLNLEVTLDCLFSGQQELITSIFLHACASWILTAEIKKKRKKKEKRWWWWQLFPCVRGFFENVRQFISCLHFKLIFFFFLVEISSGTLIPFFRPGSVQGGSAS